VSDIDRASLPLRGKRILVTRTQQQAGTLRDRLAVLGATPTVFPTIRIVPPANWETLDAAFARLFLKDEATGDEGYSWLIFTSANAVNICCERLLQQSYDLGRLRQVRIATIGPATAAALARYGLTAQLIPDEYIAEGVADALLKDTRQRGESLVGKHILLPRAAEARNVLVRELQQAGAIVDEIAAYSTLPVASNDALGRDVLHLLQTHQIDIITFTSSSTVRNFVQWLTGTANIRIVTENGQLKIACIGPITAQTAGVYGLTVHIEAQEFTIDGLVEAIVKDEKDNFLRR
jgi:uroporphyrinogen-III synthase